MMPVILKRKIDFFDSSAVENCAQKGPNVARQLRANATHLLN